jgi:hypothetical protein
MIRISLLALCMIVMLAACTEKERPQTMVINDAEHPYNERLLELVDNTKGRSKSEITQLQLIGIASSRTV